VVLIKFKENKMELLIGTTVICLASWTIYLYKNESRHQENERKIQLLQERVRNSKK